MRSATPQACETQQAIHHRRPRRDDACRARACGWSTVVVLALAGAIARAQSPPSPAISYETDIAPILRTYCAGCHNDTDLEGKLSMETYARFRQGGEDHGDPIRPGDPEGSFLIASLEGREKPRMPPKDEPPVPAAELDTLRRWVAAGAAGPARDESILRTLAVEKLPPSTAAPPITAAAFSANGRRLAIARATGVEIQDAASGAVEQSIPNLPGKVNAVHFSPDGSQVVVATGVAGLHGVAQLRAVSGGGLIREFGGHADILYDAELSPDGSTLATAGYDRVIRLWRVGDGSLVRTIDSHKGAVFDLAWHPSGRVLASASADETIKLWRVEDGVRLDTLNQAQGELSSVVFTADGGHILAGGKDRRIHHWRVITDSSPGLNPVLHSRFAHESPVAALALSADGRHLLSSADDRSLKLWAFPDLVLEHAYPPQPDIASVLAPAPAPGMFFVARMDGSSAMIALPPTGAPETAGDPAPPAPARPGPVGEAPAPAAVAESEPNNTPGEAVAVGVPGVVTGAVTRAGDAECFRFRAAAGEELTIEVDAARSKSKLDSRLEVLHGDGRPVEQVVLQATRDSWFTFRGKDSDISDDFRLHNWAEMELNEYLYAGGEVVRLWLYPRGPDSGFKVYPGSGKRRTFFGTSPLVHALGAPAYIVTPLPPSRPPPPNGLPVFHLSYENDDDPDRRFGADSVVLFTAPAAGEFVVRLTDVRGFGGEAGFGYSLTVRPRRPDFRVAPAAAGLKVSPGSAREIAFTAERFDGFDGPIRIDIANLPAGFSSTAPVEIETGQDSAIVLISAAPGAVAPEDAADRAVRVTATATPAGTQVVRDLGTLGDLQLAPPAKVTLEILPGEDRSYVTESAGSPFEFSIRPGRTISARVRAVRHDFAGRIELGGDDSGRNLPHGLYVDNIGLNGLLIVEGQTGREFFITASAVARPGTRLFHLRTSADGTQASPPARIRVLPAAPSASSVRAN